MKSNKKTRVRPIPYRNEDKELLKELGMKINQLRTEKELTQYELAEMSGVHKNFISIVENGIQNPSLINLYHIARALDITLFKLFEGS